MKHLSPLFVFMMIALGAAQDLTADEVLAQVTEAAQTLQDARFLVTGQLIDPDGTEIALEVDVQVMPGASVARADFFQPDALADNFIIYNEDAVYNYVFLTNQVTVFNADDPDALGALFPEGQAGESLDLSLNLEQLFEGYAVSLEGYGEAPVGNAYTLRFTNDEADVQVAYVDAEVIDGEWYPYSLTFYTDDNTTVAKLFFEDFNRDVGLDAADLAYYPDDAEVIDER